MAPSKSNPPRRSRLRKALLILTTVVLVCALAVAIAADYALHHAGPILKGRVIQTLETHFGAHVELDTFNVSIGRGLEVSGSGLRIFAPPDMIAAGDTTPVFTAAKFSFHSGIRGLFEHPTHVHTVRVEGLEIRIPPRNQRAPGVPGIQRRKIEVAVDEIICTDSRILILPSKPGKNPKDFELKNITLRGVGRGRPLEYEATLENAIPRGHIHAHGTFGPWNPEAPGDSPLTGTYRFDHADLNPLKGIGGILSSTGQFSGQLNKIAVSGTTETPDFSLDTANQPMPLSTTFQAIVDGTTGDTYLQQVSARLGRSDFTCTGQVVNQDGHGHSVDLAINVPHGRLEDFLSLAVKTRPVVMTATLGMKTSLHIPAGPGSVTQKIQLQSGTFSLGNIHFSNPATQDKVDELSLRAQGDPRDAHAGAGDVLSHMTGQFVMNGGRLTIHNLDYTLPGAKVALDGVYSLDGEQFEFAGKVRTQAMVSQMIKPGWKSMLLKLADPFFKKNGAGAEIPVKISGTKEAPHFGLDFGGKEQKKLVW
jgi:hypothetical protein